MDVEAPLSFLLDLYSFVGVEGSVLYWKQVHILILIDFNIILLYIYTNNIHYMSG